MLASRVAALSVELEEASRSPPALSLPARLVVFASVCFDGVVPVGVLVLVGVLVGVVLVGEVVVVVGDVIGVGVGVLVVVVLGVVLAGEVVAGVVSPAPCGEAPAVAPGA